MNEAAGIPRLCRTEKALEEEVLEPEPIDDPQSNDRTVINCPVIFIIRILDSGIDDQGV